MADPGLPRILAFMCRWCGYSCADLAGTSRIHYPASIRGVEVSCSCMVHPEWVVRPLLAGVDGVMIFGCHMGECHYGRGNEIAQNRAEMILETLEDLGIEPERFSINWVSAAEAHRFAELVTQMTERLKALGPAPRLQPPAAAAPLQAGPPSEQIPFIHISGRTRYYWDGVIYQDHRSAQNALGRYLDMNLEAKLVPEGGRLLIYTRKMAQKAHDRKENES